MMAGETGTKPDGTPEGRGGQSLGGMVRSRATASGTMADELQEDVRQRQQARLARRAPDGGFTHGPSSRWVHVKLAELFREAGNRVYETGHDRELESGHQPFHGSRSRRCLRIDATLGLCTAAPVARAATPSPSGWPRPA